MIYVLAFFAAMFSCALTAASIKWLSSYYYTFVVKCAVLGIETGIYVFFNLYVKTGVTSVKMAQKK